MFFCRQTTSPTHTKKLSTSPSVSPKKKTRNWFREREKGTSYKNKSIYRVGIRFLFRPCMCVCVLYAYTRTTPCPYVCCRRYYGQRRWSNVGKKPYNVPWKLIQPTGSHPPTSSSSPPDPLPVVSCTLSFSLCLSQEYEKTPPLFTITTILLSLYYPSDCYRRKEIML